MKSVSRKLLLACFLAGLAKASAAEGMFVVHRHELTDNKAVFATVQSINEVPARVRIGGTVTSLSIDEGSAVQRDQLVAMVVDEKLSLQIKALAAQIAGLESQVSLAQADLNRAQKLFASGTIPKARFDQAQTAYDAAVGALGAQKAQQAVINQQTTEGEVHAPTAGRVLNVPVTVGAVVLPGETIATIATENFILRLRIPERHARSVKEGDAVFLEGSEFDPTKATEGKITKVYPQIENGRVVADAEVAGLGDFFVGERVRVRITAGQRTGFTVPVTFVTTRAGVDYVRVKAAEGEPVEVAVQLGERATSGEQVEVLSGLKDGDVLVGP